MNLRGGITADQNCFPVVCSGPWWTAPDFGKRVESTSQAEYAGSIPVIGSTLTSSDAVERRFGSRSRYGPLLVSTKQPDSPSTTRRRWAALLMTPREPHRALGLVRRPHPL